MIKINHLIIGVSNLHASEKFYKDVLGFHFIERFTDTGTNQEGIVLSTKNGFDILLVLFGSERLPSPQHIALEVDETTFTSIYRACEKNEIFVRADPSLSSKNTGTNTFEQSGAKWTHFYFCDPSGLNIEILKVGG